MSLAARFAHEKEHETEVLSSTTESEPAGSEPPLVHAPHDDAGAGSAPPPSSRHAAIVTHPPLSNHTHNTARDSNDFPTMTAGTPFPQSTDDMRTKMALTLEEHLHDIPDAARERYAHTLEIDRSSPKPCIVPGNALQLIDDDPHTITSRTPPPIIIVANNNSAHASLNTASSSHDSPSDPETTGSSVDPESATQLQPRPVPKVRFRSRVRITSGLRKHRHSTSTIPGAQTPSTCSSCSGSPSSSISAPLRWQADENTTWGPLGRRLSAYAHGNGWQKRLSPTSPTSPKNGGPYDRARGAGDRANERTPLMSSQRGRMAYVDSGLDGGGEADDETLAGGSYDIDDLDEAENLSLRALALKREEDAVFGKWPLRLFNRHWWWWQIEPVLCCCCADDSDYDELQ